MHGAKADPGPTSMPEKNNSKSTHVVVSKPGSPPESLTWSEIVRRSMDDLGGAASLPQLYSIIERHPRAKTAAKKNIHAKIRQVLQTTDGYVRLDRGTWAFSSTLSEEKLAKARDLRRKLYPRRSAKR